MRGDATARPSAAVLRPLEQDLAPGDARATSVNWSELGLRTIRGPQDPELSRAYERLWAEFGAEGAMEQRSVIEQRLAWDPAHHAGDRALLYEIFTIVRGGELIALRDHTAVARRPRSGQGQNEPIVVHLSHALIEPESRGSGLAGWLRALPLQTARRCATAAGLAENTPVILVAEMEHPDPHDPATGRRLRSYERAGFRKLDPIAAPYFQPDFRPPSEHDTAPPTAIPFALILRCVGRESEVEMSSAQVRTVVDSIYSVYGEHIAAAAIDPLRRAADRWISRQPSFKLVPPTA